VESFAFSPQDDAYRGRVVGFGVALVSAFVEADKPVARFLQFFHCLRQIGDLCDRQMRNGTGRGARDRVRQPDCAAFRNDHAMRAGGEGRSNDGAEIVRIFDAVEKNNESFASVTSTLVRCRENAFECGWCARGGKSDDTLMIFRIGKAVELAAVFKADRNVARTRELDDFLDPSILSASSNEDAIEGAARVQGFANGMNTSELVHAPKSVQHAGARYIVPLQLHRRPQSVESGAEFQDALARGLDGRAEGKTRGFVEKQDHAIEFAFARATSERESNGMKKLATSDA
jgi:hypothetical protein